MKAFILHYIDFSLIPAAHCNAKQAPAGMGMCQVIFGWGELRLQIYVTGCSLTWSQESPQGKSALKYCF